MFPQEIQDFADQFVRMQRERHLADYDPFEHFSRSTVSQFIEETKAAIAQFNRVDRSDYSVSGLTTNDELRFSAKDTSESFTIRTKQDADCHHETVDLDFGTLPTGVSAGSMPMATVTIEDDETCPNPTITVSGSRLIWYAENETDEADTYTADPSDDITWSLSGDDHGFFNISGGVLAFRSPPNFENPHDSGGNNVYDVTINASKTGYSTGSLDVTVRVTNVNEPPVGSTIGNRTLAANVASREIDMSSYFSDPERDDITYIAKSSSQSVVRTSVSESVLTLTRGSAGSAIITVTAADRPVGDADRQTATETFIVTVAPIPNAPPTFDEGPTATRTVPENTRSGTSFGDPISASDSDNDTLTYSLGGTDAASFSIATSTGQLKTKAALDYETKNSYSVTVSVDDDNGGSDSIAVVIAVTNVNELPTPAVPTVWTTTGDATVTLDWHDVTYADGYDVQYWVISGSGDCCWVILDPNDADNPYPITFSGSSAVITGLANGATHWFQVRSKNVSGESGWTDIIRTTLRPKLAAPYNLDIVPLQERKMRLSWKHSANADENTQYYIYLKAPSGASAQLAREEEDYPTTDQEIYLDRLFRPDPDSNEEFGLAEHDYFDIWVVAKGKSASMLNSEPSESIRITDTAILSANGYSGLPQNQLGPVDSRPAIKWSPPTNVKTVKVRYRRLGESSPGVDHTSEEWRLSEQSYPTDPDVTRTDPDPAVGEITNPHLELGQVYALQLIYETEDGWVYSAGDSFVWSSTGFPPDASRVAGFPFFGHWEDGRFDYTVCEKTFLPADMRTEWTELIVHAFEQWKDAAPNQVEVTHVEGSCTSRVRVSDLSPIPLPIILPDPIISVPLNSDIPITLVKALHNESNEVYMVNTASYLMPAIVAYSLEHNLLFLCVLFGEACVISPRYWDPSKGAGKQLDPGSVDVLINGKRAPPNVHMRKMLTLDIPGNDRRFSSDDVSFNACRTDGRENFDNYELIVHEAGHALGLSDHSYNPLAILDLRNRIAHPQTTDTVMNFGVGVNEPDCSPYPLDIMAIHALYQALDP